MKGIVLQAWLLLAAFVAPLASAFAQGEEILQFDSRILVRSNGSMQVTETIRVRSRADKIRHGIYRDFPQMYSDRWGLRTQTGFDVLSVTRDGWPEPYHTEKQANGTRVYFGSASVELPPGTYTYELVYGTDRQLGFFKDHDELYWNVTGNGWIFPIKMSPPPSPCRREPNPGTWKPTRDEQAPRERITPPGSLTAAPGSRPRGS